jgi:hypothetical protein
LDFYYEKKQIHKRSPSLLADSFRSFSLMDYEDNLLAENVRSTRNKRGQLGKLAFGGKFCMLFCSEIIIWDDIIEMLFVYR